MHFVKSKIPSKIVLTNGFFLKAVESSDSSELFRIVAMNQSYFSQFDFQAPYFKNITEVVDLIEYLTDHRSQLNGVSYGLWNQSNQWLGLFTINKINWDKKSADLGFWLAEASAGKGFAFMAVSAVMKVCWDELGLNMLTSHTAVTNERSQKLLEKLGFKKMKLLKDQFIIRGKSVDDYLYKIKHQRK